jgi:site-specific DNA recombinase
MEKALIYCRISKDHAGEGLGVERQRQECERLAERLGVTVTRVFTDNDFSAYSGKHRPAYEALLTSLRAGEAEVVIAWNIDRLYRRMRSLEDYIDLVETKGIRTETVVAGSFDLNTPMGRAIARNAIAFATLEVDQSRARVKSAKAQAAQAGKPSGGQRAFGYEDGNVMIRESEAATIKWMADRIMAGSSFRSVSMDLNAQGTTTGHGFEWNALKVRNILINKRYVGIRVHKDTEYPAIWPGIFTEDEWAGLQLAIRVSRTMYKQRGPFRKHVLNGFVYCGDCGARLLSATKVYSDGHTEPTWRCLKRRDIGHDGCGKVTRLMAPVDDLIADAIVYRLNSPELRAELARQSDNHELGHLISQERAQESLLEELLEDRSTGLLTRGEYETAKVRASGHLSGIRQKIAACSVVPSDSLPTSLTRNEWDQASIEWRRSVLDLLVERIDIMPGQGKRGRYKQWAFNCDLIIPHWRG